MKPRPLLLCLLAASTLFNACEKNSSKPEDSFADQLVGTWRLVESDVETGDLKYLVFQEDHVFRQLRQDDSGMKGQSTGYYSYQNGYLETNTLMTIRFNDGGQQLLLSEIPGQFTLFEYYGDQTLFPDWTLLLDNTVTYPMPYPYIPYYSTLTTDGSAMYILFANRYGYSDTDGSSILKTTLEGDSIGFFTGTNIGYAVSYGDGSLWTTHAGLILELDPETGEALSRIDLPFDYPLNPITWKDGSLFGFHNYASSPLYEIDLSSGNVVEEYNFPGCRDITLVDGEIIGTRYSRVVSFDLNTQLFDQTWNTNVGSLDGITWANGSFYVLRYGFSSETPLYLHRLDGAN